MKFLFPIFAFLLSGTSAFAEPAVQLTSGATHTCLLREGKVSCWGGNEYGQANVPELRDPVMVSAGYYHTCALDAEGVKCWGLNKQGQTNVPPLNHPRMVSAGHYHSCALDDDGVKCWWYNRDGESQVPPLQNPRFVAAGDRQTCALDDTGLKCWGSVQSFSRRMVGTPRSVTVSNTICAIDDQGLNCTAASSWMPQLKHPRLVQAGPGDVCAVDDDGLKCWGNSNSSMYSPYPEFQEPVFGKLQALSVGLDHACGLDEHGLQCWGRQYTNQPELKNPRLLRAGDRTACAVDDDGLKCWGYNAARLQKLVPALDHPVALSIKSSYACAIDNSGLRCWGSDERLNKVPAGLEQARDVKIGRHSVCAATPTAIVCWRMYSDLDMKTYPIKDPQGFTFDWGGGCAREGAQLKCWDSSSGKLQDSSQHAVQVASGEYSTMLIDDQNRLLSNSSFTSGWWSIYPTPFTISGPRGLSVGQDHTCVFDSSGIRCFNIRNQFDQTAITRVPPLANPEGLVSGMSFACALDGGKVECWGDGYDYLRQIPKW